jgi:predicted nicotinamide N-methyase
VKPLTAAEQVRLATVVDVPLLVPSVRLHLVTPQSPLWLANEAEAEAQGIPMPYWAFAWPGGQALGWYVERNPEVVRDHVVLCFGAGAGLEAIVAQKAGASRVVCTDLDPLACAAMTLNAQLNDVALEVHQTNVLGRDDGWQVVLAGDVTYEPELAGRVMRWLGHLARRGAMVLLGDPGRVPLEGARLSPLASVDAPHDGDPRGTTLWATRVWRVEP